MTTKTVPNADRLIQSLFARVTALRKVLELAPPRSAVDDQRYWDWLKRRDEVLDAPLEGER